MVVLLVVLVGCNDNACHELARKICDCQPSYDLRAKCDSQVEYAIDTISEDSLNADKCEKKLETCNCDAVRSDNHNYFTKQCGLSSLEEIE